MHEDVRSKRMVMQSAGDLRSKCEQKKGSVLS